MLGRSRVAAQLAASQEGLSSMSDDDDESICKLLPRLECVELKFFSLFSMSIIVL
jgi:hypothetical protein